jgi:acyl carrier protein
MDDRIQFDRSEISALVLSSLQEILSENEDLSRALGESTYLIGQESVLDSLGLVTLIVELEQRLNEKYGVSLTVADDRAMSQRNSPFRTVKSLIEYVCLLAEEKQRKNGHEPSGVQRGKDIGSPQRG